MSFLSPIGAEQNLTKPFLGVCGRFGEKKNRKSGVVLGPIEIAGKFDGYSEAWSKSTFEVKSIKELMRLTVEFESE